MGAAQVDTRVPDLGAPQDLVSFGRGKSRVFSVLFYRQWAGGHDGY
jgi:hypothetical protein